MAIYKAITFAPVQGFIEKSRKLRDLSGSSFLLSYLSRVICNTAETDGCQLISPANINVTRGTPNQILIKGNFPETKAKEIFYRAWETIVTTCREWIEKKLAHYPYHWRREWNSWANHTWEFFWADGETIDEARKKLNEKKRSRDWTGINWHGESSTLSGADAIAWYGMTDRTHPVHSDRKEQKDQIDEFYKRLSRILTESILDPEERLSIPELIKRLITLNEITEELYERNPELPPIEPFSNFTEINRWKDNPEEKRYSGWFQGDGDSIGQYLIQQARQNADEAGSLYSFSEKMLEWGENLPAHLPRSPEREVQHQRAAHDGQIIYAGGDDFLGVLYRNYPRTELSLDECLNWFGNFPRIWNLHGLPITVSVGFVWAAAGVPQRDILQHCREAEKTAKNRGRDRLAVRILFNSGNYLEWVCPWWFLGDVIAGYKDRRGGKNWTHFYNDVAVLESRHAFNKHESTVALGLFKLYFGKDNCERLEHHQWDRKLESKVISGVLGNQESDVKNPHQILNQWIVDLSKIGIHLCSNT